MPADPKESENKALEELKVSITDIGSKFDDTLSGINTRLDSFQKTIDDIPDPVAPIDVGTTDEGYVSKGWSPDSGKGWNDIFSEGAKISEEIAEKKVTAGIDAYKAELQKASDTKAAEDKAVNENWDNQLAGLEKAGRLAKVENDSDPNDPGRVARRELFKLGTDYGSSNLNKMADLRDKIKGIPAAGAFAPVGSSSSTTQPSKTMNYADIHDKDYDELVREEFPQ